MRRRPREFSSWLASYFERFVALKRASGLLYNTSELLLSQFDQYLATQVPEAPLRPETLTRYWNSLDRLSPRARGNAIGVVWPAIVYAQRHGAFIENLPPRPSKPSRYWRQRQPHIFSAEEIERMLVLSQNLPPLGSLKPATIATLIGLLYTTGIRIGEALALDVGDLDQREGILTVRKGKFGKSRALPLRESVAQALKGYLEDSRRLVSTGTDDPFFVSGRRRRLSYCCAHQALRVVFRQTEIKNPLPRPHDFRHTFAINRVDAWYKEGRNVNILLPALSTYLGHVSVENTRLYLVANGILLEHAVERFAHRTSAIEEMMA